MDRSLNILDSHYHHLTNILIRSEVYQGGVSNIVLVSSSRLSPSIKITPLLVSEINPEGLGLEKAKVVASIIYCIARKTGWIIDTIRSILTK